MIKSNFNVCPYCHSTLAKTYGLKVERCSNKDCKSHIFIVGNRVHCPQRTELGIGRITDIIPIKAKSTNESNPTLFHTKSHKKSNKITSFERNSDKDLLSLSDKKKFNQFLVEFTTFLEKPLFKEEISHFLWDLDKKVRFKDGIGVIIGRNLAHPTGLIHYTILLPDGTKKTVAEIDIISELESPLNEFLKGNQDGTYQFLLRYWGAQIYSLYTSNLLKIITHSRLSLLPHQIAVAHHLLDIGQARYILADEVGLGKTIEAGIYVKEMIARNLATRVLIITPASIVGQWEFELENKFNLKFTRLKSKVVKNLKVNYQSGNFFNSQTGQDLTLCTVTLQYARLQQCAKLLTRIEWDIVIFDEAHHLRRYLTNQKTEQYRTTLAYELAQNLSAKARSLLLLTATPIQLHSFDLFSLIQLLNPYEFPNFDSFEAERKKISLLNLVVKNLQLFTSINSYERDALVYQIKSFHIKITETELNEKLRFESFRREIIAKLEQKHFLSRYVIRNRRRVVFPDNPIKRIPQIIDVDLTKDELEVYNKIHLYLAKIYSQNYETGPSGMGFVMVILQKLLTSSVPAILKSLKKRILYLEENKETLLKLGMEQEAQREFTDDESSMDLAWGLDELDVEDRMVIQARKRKMIPKKKGPSLDINEHIRILKEFVQDLESLDYDSKASRLLEIVKSVIKTDPKEKFIIFTQFKKTLFYLQDLIEKEGIKVAPFHGDLTESQKMASVSSFRHDIPILLSTEIGGEGRNFQFCHIIVNYDLPWNPMRLEQRIGRLDRFGQTKDILIFNFYIKDTVESSIITAISERIHLFEESIGALEPILGSLEGQITSLVLKEDESPMKFRLDEVISKTSNKIDEVYDKLEDLILDKRSFQYDYISRDLSKKELLTGIDIHIFLDIFVRYVTNDPNFRIQYPEFQMDLNLVQKPHDIGVWLIKFSEALRRTLRIPHRRYEGVFDIDLARKQEEFDFFSLGHPLVMNLIDWSQKSDFGGNSCQLTIDIKQWASLFIYPYGSRIPKAELDIFKRLLRFEVGLNLFLFEIEFLGVIIEKSVIPIFITDDLELLPILGRFISKPHNFAKILQFNAPSLDLAHLSISREKLERCLESAKQSTKNQISEKAQRLIKLNKEKYLSQKMRVLKNANFKKKFAETQMKLTENALRAKKLKLPTERQRQNLDQLSDPVRKKRRIKQFMRVEKEVQYYENEIERWSQILENLEFDVPQQLKRLKKHRKLLINANFLSYARINLI
ncbi:DEAD/DEAH box helicase [Candidatus Lokiarchaeum ossiferum]|uniref:DEAD/DEAH box helicase n=1 Tax=Candidatus Lokiarchaeum ossiferum TaxID=2951803 RepID=UPI00352C542B